MLHTQAASETALQTSDSITVVRYGEHAFSQIRRFVVVEVRRGFVYAWYVRSKPLVTQLISISKSDNDL